MLTVINKDGTFSGVQYTENKQKYIDHHKQYGQKCIWLERALEVDEEGNPTELPTVEELVNEVTVGDDKRQEMILEMLIVDSLEGN